MTKAATVAGQSLMDDFGAEQHEIGPMIDQFLALATGLGLPRDGVTPVEHWLVGEGFNPVNLWIASLERVRSSDVTVH